MKEIIQNIVNRFEIYDIEQKKDNFLFLSVKKEQAISLITHLRDIESFSHLVLITAVDWIEDNKLQLTYILNSPKIKSDIGVRVFIDRENAIMDSAHHLWEHAATYQRELREMFGIDFPHSPRINESFILEGWDNIPPYRRDFDTKKYAEETFFPRPGRKTNDPSQYMKKKLYPDE